jgi:hypothetical protein
VQYGVDVSNNQPLTPDKKNELIARMKTAWTNLPDDKKKAIKPLLDDAHKELGDFIRTGKAPKHRFHNVLRMKSYLTYDWDEHEVGLAPLAEKAVEIKVGPEGEILGTGRYEQLDPRWELMAGTVWLENLLHKHPFPVGAPSPVSIPDKVTIFLAGDFGTGNFGANDSPSTKISKIILSQMPQATIHLGDVYYAGTTGEEASKLINYWPRGSIASFALNSNHEMYSGGGPYFNDAVGGPLFNKYQSPFSFFALENSNWVLIGLDSAYNAGEMSLYMDGSLGHDSAQLPFLRSLVKKGKKVMVMTHHNGFELKGQQATPLRLFSEVIGAFEGAAPPAYWYWGHKHAGAAYKPLNDLNGLRCCRCVGHAALPWGLSSDLQTSSQVEWFEARSAGDPENRLRVLNGFVKLELDGDKLTETFYDETGRIAWTPQNGDTRNRV